MNEIKAEDFYIGHSDLDGPSLECPYCWWYVYLEIEERTLKHLLKKVNEHLEEKHK